MKLIGRSAALCPLVLMGLLACVGSDPNLVSPDEDRDAGAVEAGSTTEAGATDAGAMDTGPTAGNLLTGGDFERSGCLGWQPNQALPTLDEDKHAGKFACRVCSAQANSVWGIYQSLENLAEGAYTVRGFARASGDAGPFEVLLRLETLDVASGPTGDQREKSSGTLLPGAALWAEMETEIQVAPGQGLAVAVLATQLDGCFLVDDVTLVKK